MKERKSMEMMLTCMCHLSHALGTQFPHTYKCQGCHEELTLRSSQFCVVMDLLLETYLTLRTPKMPVKRLALGQLGVTITRGQKSSMVDVV